MSLDFWDLTFRVSSDTFVQTNYQQMLVLYRTALDMLRAGAADRVLDLYAGIGTLSVAIARDSAGVAAVEENPRAVHVGRLHDRVHSGRGEGLPRPVGNGSRRRPGWSCLTVNARRGLRSSTTLSTRAEA